MAKTFDVQKVTIKTAQIYNYEHKQSLLPTSKRYSRYIIKNGVVQLKHRKGNHCLRQWQGGVVTVDGHLVPCCFDKNADFLFGNLQTHTLQSVWHGEAANRFRRQILQARQHVSICADCGE